MEGKGKVVGKQAPQFVLKDHLGQSFDLSVESAKNPLLLAFYPGGKLPIVCTGQFCDYRDAIASFDQFGVQIVGLSSDSAEKQKQFAEKNNYPFRFLVDQGNAVAKLYGSMSALMLGAATRSIFIVSKGRILLYSYVEPTTLTKRGSKELIGILDDLRRNELL